MLKNFFIKLFFFIAGSVILTGCNIHEPQQAHVQDAIDGALNEGIHDNTTKSAHSSTPRRHQYTLSKTALNNMLVPAVNVKLPDVKTTDDNEFDVRAVELPANTFFTSLVKNTSYNVLVDPDVNGNISLVLRNVTVQEAIEAACSAYGFQYEKTTYGYHIETKKLVTKVFTINYLDVSRGGTSKTRVTPTSITDVIQNNSGGTSGSTGSSTGSRTGGGTDDDSSNVQTTIDNNFWKDLKTSLGELIGDKNGREVVVNPSSGLVIVRAFPNELRSVSTYLDSMQNIMTRQVILEAKVMEVQLNAQYQAGIQWQLLGLNLNGTQSVPNELAPPNGMFTLNVNNNSNFKSVINLLNTQGTTKVLSSPRIATMDNQKAIIKVGNEEFFVTNVSNTTTAIGTTAGVVQNITFTPFFSGIALDVTPEITKKGNVMLHIHPVISQVATDQKSFVLSGQPSNLPLAKSSIRESDSVVHAKNGEVIIIGGLMQNDTKSFDASVPGLDQMPFKASLGRHDKEANKIELVILLKPIIVGNNSKQLWADRMTDAKRVFRNMSGTYSYTAHPISQSDQEEGSFSKTVTH